MTKSLTSQSDDFDYDINFLTGIYCLFSSKYRDARHFFLSSVYDNYPLEKYYAVYQSYLGLSNVLLDYKDDTLSHCYHSTDTNLFSIEPEVQINLACAELIKGDRRRAFQAMDKINGLNLSPRNSEEIHSFFDLVNTRKQNNNGSLRRNTFIHKSIGKIFRKKENFNTAGHIEAFIRETAERRYKGAMLNQLL